MNRSKIAGTRWETEVVRYLRDNGYPTAERRALAGSLDKGDVAGTPFVVECKATQSIDLAGGLDELTVEIKNAGVEFGFLIIKRRRKPTSQAYAVVSLEQLCRMLPRLEPS